MDPAEQRLEILEREFRQGVARVASKTTRLTMIVLLFMLFALVFGAIVVGRQLAGMDRRLDDLNRRARQVTSAGGSERASAAEKDSLLGLNARMNSLENLQEAMASTSQAAFEQMNYVFTIVAAFFGLFSLFFAYRQITSDANREEHDVEMRSLVGSFQNNIQTISSLISTLEHSFAYREVVEGKLREMSERARVLESHREESEAALQGQLASLNLEAVRLFQADIDRANLSLEENRRRLDSFANKLTSAERVRDVEAALNPFCYYIRGLTHVGTYQYENAITDLETAYRKGREESGEARSSNYALEDREGIKNLLSHMLIACSYFQGVSYKNLGRYPESRRKFQEALKMDSAHLQSATYLLQVEFFDSTVSFEQVEQDYARALEEIERLKASGFDQDKLRKSFATLKINQGSMYLKKVVNPDFREGYRKFESPERAVECFWDAYESWESDLAIFGLAQAMEDVGSSSWRRLTPQDLYRRAMTIVKRRVAEDPDRLYSVMLYYMLAICSRKLRLGDSSEVYLSQARYSLKEVPSYVTVYSPISRVRLSRSQILGEMEIFEKTFQ